MFVHFYLKALKLIVQNYAKLLSSEKDLLRTLARCRGSMTFCRKSQQNTKTLNKIEQAAEANLVAIPKLVDQIVSVLLDNETNILNLKDDKDEIVAVGKTVFLCLKIRKEEEEEEKTNLCISEILDGVSKMFSLALKRERSSDSILSSVCETIYECWSKQASSSTLEIALLKEIALGDTPCVTFVVLAFDISILTRQVQTTTTDTPHS